MTSIKSDKRLTEVLELFLLPNYSVVSTTYLDLLLTHISENTKECSTHDYEYCEIFQKWLLKALDVWSNGNVPSQPIVSFTLKLVGLVARNELRFHYWHCQDAYNKLCKTLNLQEDNLSASVKMAYTTMLSNLITHRSGRQWVIESNAWRQVVNCALQNHTMYVTRESQKFVWSLLLYEQHNVDFCKEVILAVAKPLINTTFNARIHPAMEQTYLDENNLLCTALDLSISIIENTLFVSLDNKIPALFEECVNLEMRVKALFEACLSTRFLQHVYKLFLLSLFIKLKSGIKGHMENIDVDAWQKFRYNICYISMMLLSKKYVVELVRIQKFALMYWKKLRTLREFTLPEQHKFEHQAIAIMVLPLFVCIKRDYMNHDLFDMFINKMFDVTCTTVQRLAYNMRDLIWKESMPLEQICKTCIDLLLETIDIMDRDVAVITFQMFCHVLKNYLPDVVDDTTKFSSPERKVMFKAILGADPIVENATLLASLLNGIAVMTEKFKLKWQECVETICVLALAQEILNHPGILPMICVKALKVCKLAIHNFMPPNLALLVDSDSHMNELGPTLFKRLHDPNWEVRDSVLEVLNTIAVISEDKYPAFQDFLLTNKFLPLAIEIAVADGESYVRASSLTFISTTVRINRLWDEKLKYANLPDTAMNLLYNESEAIVRREAVALLTELYVNKTWPKCTVSAMSRAMSVAAVFDLHWEVKINALQYWKHFIISHLSDQGMLDGSFPNVTFSKEHRKIVALNETEIKRRVNKALDELAKQRCLGVLLVTLEDECDFQVCKASATILSKFKAFLLKYKLDEPLPEAPLPRDSATFDSAYVKQVPSVSEAKPVKTPTNSYNVINEIVDANDANLLASIYNNSLKMDSEVNESEKKTLEHISCISREDFLQTVFKTDLDGYIEQKSQWLQTYTSSFESVLDDILTMHQQENVNSMDCY